jgi:uncharacterized RDD family membrane protein YckC
MTTNWYYASEDRQMGPVPETEIESLASAGVIEPHTLVWHEGMPNWQAYHTVRNLLGAVPSTNSDEVPGVVGLCSQCEEAQLHSEMVRFGNNWVCANCKDRYTQRLREGTLTGGKLAYAGFGRRVGAALIDGFILWIVQVCIQLAFKSTGLVRVPPDLLLFARELILLQTVQLATSAAYYISFTYQFGGTPGKLALGCRVVTADGEKLTLGRSVGRYFASVLSAAILGIGYLMAAFDDERRTMHDRICDTRVILKSGRFV